jgi:hypothetical protein
MAKGLNGLNLVWRYKRLNDVNFPKDLIDLTTLFQVLDNLDYRLKKIEGFINQLKKN